VGRLMETTKWSCEEPSLSKTEEGKRKQNFSEIHEKILHKGTALQSDILSEVGSGGKENQEKIRGRKGILLPEEGLLPVKSGHHEKEGT